MYGYGYGYNTPSFGIGASAGIFVTLLVIAFIAAIVLAVAGYRKYVNDGDQQRFSLKDSSTWGSFFRFDKLVIDKILKALYLFCAIFTAFFFLAIVLASLANGIVAFLVSLIMCAILCLIIELIERVTFESVMLSVIITRNTTDIKGMLGGRQSSQLSPAAPDPVAPTPEVPVQPQAAPAPESTPEVTAQPQPEPKPAGGSSPAPQGVSFCPECGASVAPGSHFCPECGTKLD
ncbi:MAG: zinc-ribbon domain-containing protein [Olsenella sp.]|jgi:hypothetical protein|nr:zinc-ribbon domain-containing protein [Olsenella sp.]MCI1666727.1 zinc-ribbon domain-containing protein [Olsenella sp.]MCI2183862.1 zinc-ribbon domain-containing protein [Olsenella sp.]